MTDTPDAEMKPAPQVQFTKSRETVFELAYPFTFNGTLIDKVTVRRLTTKEVNDFMAQFGPGFSPRNLPFLSVDQDVVDAMDDDDSDALFAKVQDFLPRRLRVLGELSPELGDSTSPSPQAS